MGIRAYKPTSPRAASTRSATSPRSRPTSAKKLLEPKPRTGGRNHYGRITSRFRGGGHKQRYRIVDFKRAKIGVRRRSRDRIRSQPHRAHRAPALRDGEKTLHPRARRLKQGDTSSPAATPTSARQQLAARRHPGRHDDPQRRARKGKGGQLVRSAGVAAS
jgi:large subunit ribosomal protein L2